MEWTFQETDPLGRTLVRMIGDCDLYNAPRFKTAILERLEAGDRRMLFDMSGLRYLDSTGVGAIIAILQTSKKCGGEIVFRGVSGSPRRVLEISSILPLMKLENPSLAETLCSEKRR